MKLTGIMLKIVGIMASVNCYSQHMLYNQQNNLATRNSTWQLSRLVNSTPGLPAQVTLLVINFAGKTGITKLSCIGRD